MNLFEAIHRIEHPVRKRLVWCLLIAVVLTSVFSLIDYYSQGSYVLSLVLHGGVILTLLLYLADVVTLGTAEFKTALRARSAELQSVIDKNTAALSTNSAHLERTKDRDCSWDSATIFFAKLEDYIENLVKEKPTKLYIYRGYDSCAHEANALLRAKIVRAMESGAITEFYRVMVVTTPRSIRPTIEWITDFATSAKVDPHRCKFCIAFRLSYNLGSFVVPGPDQCFIAMPSQSTLNDVGAVAETACGVFAERHEIAEVVRQYIASLFKAAPNIHFMTFRLEEFTNGQNFDSAGLEALITQRFKVFSDAAKPNSVAP
jgi:hypothetical protein